MTRILYWNLQNFSLNKIRDNANPWQSQDRLQHILNQVCLPHLPDIIVIVEVFDRNQNVGLAGLVINPNGNPALALQLLLDQLRILLGNHWNLVPPLTLGDAFFREAVAVYYNSNNLQFIGPYLWSQIAGQLPRARIADIPALNNLVPYAGNWGNSIIPNNRNFPVGNPPILVPENQFAGQWEFYLQTPNPYVAPPNGGLNPNPNPIYFPNNFNRSPFLTQFIDLTLGGNNRVIKLFSIHTSPNTAQQAVQQLANIQEIQNVNANEVSVIVGDFNVDSFINFNTYQNSLLQLGYTIHLDPRDVNQNINLARQPYCMTHLLPVNQATPFNNTGVPANAQPNVYPRFGYMGTTIAGAVHNSGSIDNFFTRYGANVPPPQNHNVTIVNTVVGKPYNQIIPPAAGVNNVLTGGLAYLTTLANPLPLLGGIAPGAVQALINFRIWGNYGRICSTSDHLALIIDV